MKILRKTLDVILVASLALTGIGLITYYLIEFISSFLISNFNMVEIGRIMWIIILICFGFSACSIVLKCFIDKKTV